TPVRLLLAASAGALLVGVGGMGVEGSGAPEGAALAWIAAFALAGLACLWTFFSPLGRPRVVPSGRFSLVVVAIALPFAFALGSTPTLPHAGVGFAEHAFGCFAYGSILALPFLVVVGALDRSARPWPMLLAAFAAAAGLVANAALVLHCGNTEPAHLAAGHATIGVVLAALGALWAGLAHRSPS
ncbi:MAG TPA: hypothetical protein VFZ53_00285, partial [Polyangiaceae bacterium]